MEAKSVEAKKQTLRNKKEWALLSGEAEPENKQTKKTIIGYIGEREGQAVLHTALPIFYGLCHVHGLAVWGRERKRGGVDPNETKRFEFEKIAEGKGFDSVFAWRCRVLPPSTEAQGTLPTPNHLPFLSPAPPIPPFIAAFSRFRTPHPFPSSLVGFG
ncbi:unnamed protein product [Sphenostylis stenocarpa]|uniref:Uncharacterized protein n=1 Tax=Sphenostylis stenocarpa TaxID=92480 RepID=A0AA86VKN2_9FABA|nr:unnamed protein product [Sphenostylis stenocarpa]